MYMKKNYLCGYIKKKSIFDELGENIFHLVINNTFVFCLSVSERSNIIEVSSKKVQFEDIFTLRSE